MNTKKLFLRNRFWIILLTVLFCIQNITGQIYKLDYFDLICDELPLNARTISKKADIGSYIYHFQVGGISFEQTALPSTELINKKISLDYIDNKLIIHIGNQKFYPELPAWQLAPIAEFSDSGTHSAFTLYGNNIDAGMNIPFLYHPAFIDNLVGLRLFQADILLPRYNPKKVLKEILAFSIESTIDQSRKNGQSENDIYLSFKSLLESFGTENVTMNNYKESYINLLSQLFETFMPVENNLAGMWNLPKKDNEYIYEKSETKFLPHDKSNLIQIEKELSDEASNVLIEIFKKYTRNYLKQSPENAIQNLTEFINQIFQNSEFQNFYILTDWNRPVTFYIRDNQLQIDSNPWYLFSALDPIAQKVDLLTEASELYNKKWSLLKAYNPAVITVVENVAKWSAFFRYVKQNNPENWNKFMDKMNILKDHIPFIPTPIYYKLNEHSTY